MKLDFAKLDRAFNPRCVVVVGDKREGGFRWLNGQSAFKGKLYSVQIDPAETIGIKALGVQNCASLLDIPEPIDLVIVAVPRAAALKVLEDCIRKEVACVHFFTAGFSETNTEEGRSLERRLIERAEQANVHLIGPNCMGIFNPRLGIRQFPEQYTGITGPVGFIAQSGSHANSFAREGNLQGVNINKSVSFGNGIVLAAADFLEYFGSDPEIKAIGMYLEGVRDGRRFFQVLRKVAAEKPVVIWKGGRTEAGGRATASHTGSLAVPQVIWDTIVRQCGAIQVATLDELVDTIKAILSLAPVRGDRVGITGGSGGLSVVIADAFAEAGLKVPLLTQQSYDELATFFTIIGGAYRNPIDTGNPNSREMKRILGILESDANIDNLVLSLSARGGGPGQSDTHVSSLVDIKQRTAKPVMAVISYSFLPQDVERARGIIQELQDGGVPTFLSVERGARALKNTLDYYRSRNGAGSP
ncbi:MAG: CoA-binding protein [Dehalococcoidales bacterium]|nr:CoA-binding protein [Dehalococcoidales bacterium]